MPTLRPRPYTLEEPETETTDVLTVDPGIDHQDADEEITDRLMGLRAEAAVSYQTMFKPGARGVSSDAAAGWAGLE